MIPAMDPAREQEEIRAEIARLKQELQSRRDAAASLDELAGTPLQHHYPLDLWSLSDSELDNEMGKRLGFLNEDIDCRPGQAVASHRRLLGPFIVLGKKLLLKLLRPYSNSLFVRQNRFNEQLVAFHLASFIRFRRLEERLARLERRADGIPERDAPAHD